MKRQVNIAFRQSFNALVHGTTKDASRVKKQAIMSYQESDSFSFCILSDPHNRELAWSPQAYESGWKQYMN